MTHDEYAKLLSQFEAEKNANPPEFGKKVTRFITLGYLFFVGLTVFFFGLFLVSILISVMGYFNRLTLYLFIGSGAGLFTVLKMIFIKFPAPEGETLMRADAPLLFDRLAELGQKLGSPPIKAVRLIDELNANASAVPKFFLFGKPDLHVAVGLPLMSFLKRDELDAVLAHELAHHTNRDTDVSLRVHRVMGVWEILARSSGSWIDWSPHFARWYYPRIAAMSAVLSRDMEFAADRMAGRAVGAETMARALMRMTFSAGERSAKYKDVLFAGADELETPFTDRTARMLSVSRVPVEVSVDDLEAEARRESLTGDSHPSLRERLASLGVNFSADSESVGEWKSDMELPLDETALDWYLGGSQSPLVKKLDMQWANDEQSNWKRFRENRVYSRAIVAEYQSRSEPLIARERADYAYWLGMSGKQKEALAFLENCRAELPDDLPILRAFALSAIATNDPRTSDLLDELYKIPAFRFEADEYRYGWLQSQGLTQEAEAVASRLRAGSKDWTSTVETIMPWHPLSRANKAEMSGVEFKKIRSILANHKQIEAAYCALMDNPELPGLFRKTLLITINLGLFYRDSETQYAKLARVLFEELDDWSSAEIRILPTKDADAKKGAQKLAAFKIYPG
jgi:Zn-dependent protease with chaperone function